jgi:CRP-like cAMP-binding protein
VSDSISRAQALRELVYFSGLTSRELEIAARALSPVEVAQGEVVFTQGEEGGWLYLLSRGAVEVSMETGVNGVDEDGNNSARRVLARLGPPALLGEMSVLLDEPRSAWAHATEPCLLWQVSREEVRQALEANQKWAQRLLLAMSKILAARLAEMNRKLAILTTQESRALDPDDLAALQQALFWAE